MQTPGTADRYSQARQWLQRGDYLQAEQSCAEALREDPQHADALHLAALIHAQTGRVESALGYVDQAIAIRPGNGIFYNSRGNMLLDAGRPQEALQAFDVCLQLSPVLGVVHSNRCNALLALSRDGEALDAADRAIALEPRYPPAHGNRGVALMELERPAEALVSLDQALSLHPDFVEALTTRGNVLLALHQPEEARSSLQRALQIKPDFYKALVNLSQAKLALNLPEEALVDIDEALRHQPLDPKSLLSRTKVLFSLGRAADAAAVALGFLEHAVGLVPDHPDLLSMLGATQIRVGEIRKGIATFERLLDIDPDYDYAVGGLVQAKMQECDWEDLDHEIARTLSAVRAGRRAAMPFILNSIPGTPLEQRIGAETFARQVMPPFRNRPTAPSRRESRYRIAYVSADFREHPVANQLVGLLEAHDRSRFEIIGVALESADESVVGRRIRESWDSYLDVPQLDPATTARRLSELDVDIAVDLSGSTLGNRMQMYAYRPAPVQVNYLGFPGTLASGCHDYIVADPVVIPLEHREFYEEKVVWLPHSYQPFDSGMPPPQCRASRLDENLPVDAFVFCSFNNRFKYNPRMFDIWMRVLDRVPGSVLWLVSCPETVKYNLRREASRRHVDPSRLVFAQRKDLRQEHIGRYQLADLFLDTLPFNAHATASDALWAGLPVLTCLGDAFAGRVAAGMLHAVSMPELIAGNLNEYEAMAVQLASAGSALGRLRERLTATRTAQPLFDLDRYRRDLESAYERMIDVSRRGLPPESFSIPA